MGRGRAGAARREAQRVSDPFEAVLGQPHAVAQLRAAADRPLHAYLFVGPAGSGKATAALAFAAAVLGDERAERGTHPDVLVVEREGAAINVAQAREIARLALRTPSEGARKVLVLTEFHLVDEAAPALLKTIEEASPSTIFVILADAVTPDLATVASRCVRIDFRALSTAVIQEALLAEGTSPDRAGVAAAASFGNLARARLLAADDDVLQRRELWRGALDRLDGSGAAASDLADAVVAAIDHAAEPLAERQVTDGRSVVEATKEGRATTTMKLLETRQKRELRRLRTDELRAGFAVLAQVVAERRLRADDVAVAQQLDDALDGLQWANEALAFNPNEPLLLQGLFARLSSSPLTAGN